MPSGFKETTGGVLTVSVFQRISILKLVQLKEISMLAAVLHESPGALSVEEVKIDGPDSHEVLIQVGATGLCHSDLHYLERSYPLSGPTVLGHEGAGVVEAG